MWDGILSISCLKDLALDSTLNRYILSALQTTDTGEENVQKCQKVGHTPQMGARTCLTVAVSGVGGVLKVSVASPAVSRWWSACRRCGSPGWKASRRCLSWSRCVATSPIWPSHYTAAVWAPPTWSDAPPSNKNTQKHMHRSSQLWVFCSHHLYLPSGTWSERPSRCWSTWKRWITSSAWQLSKALRISSSFWRHREELFGATESRDGFLDKT